MKSNHSPKNTPKAKRKEAKRSESSKSRIGKTTEVRRDQILRVEDVDLYESYSVIEIATLAAKCAGATASDQIEAAIQILSAAEWSAFLGKRERYRQRQLKAGRPEWATREEFNAEFDNKEKEMESCWQAKKICEKAERHEETGKILRTSLVWLAYQCAGIGKAGPNHALRLYNDWLRSEAVGTAQGIASKKMCEIEGHSLIDPSNFIMWTHEQFKQWEELVKPSMKAAVVELKSQSESINSAILIHDEETAYELMRGFLRFLEDIPKKERPVIIQSQKEDTAGKILSPKTRGADRADEAVQGKSKAGKPKKRGQYKSKQRAAVDE